MSSPTDRGRVLIVDDDRQVLELLVNLLNEEGYEVASALNGDTGLSLAASIEPDLVISDVVMPVVDGFELCRRLKENSRTAHVPVLLISGIRRSEDDGIEGLYAGADDYLDLPFRNEELLVKVARLVERHRIERHYREIVEQAVDIIYTRDMEGNITSINGSGARFFGRTAAELVGMHLRDLIGYEAEQHILQTKQLTNSEPLRSSYCLPNSNGETRHLEDVITVQRDRSGRALGVRAVVRDVTEQKMAQDALRESEERYRQLVELSPDAIVVHSEGKFTYLNPAAVKLWGASSPEELVGKPILSVVHPDFHDTVPKRVRQIESQEGPTPLIPQKCVKLDGEVIDVEVTGIPFSAGGKPAVQAVIRDLTDSRRAEASIRESEERYRELFENANDIIYTHDLEGNFTSLNCAGERITGYSREEMASMNVADVIAPEYLDFVREKLALRQTMSTPAFHELDIISKDGRRVRLEVSTRVIFRNGRRIGIQGIGRDLTERKHSERALLESQAFFNSFMDNSPAVAFMKDSKGRYVYVNKPFERLFGKPLTYLKGRTSYDWLPADLADKTHHHDLQILKTGQPDEVIERVATGDGTPHEWLVFKFPTVDAAGNKYVSGVGVDITERRRAEEKVARQAKREAMTHSISQAIRCSLDSHEIYQSAVRELGSYLNVDRCSLFMRNDRLACATNVAEYHAEGVTPAASDFSLSHLQVLIKALDETGVLSFSNAARDERISQLYANILSKADVKSIMYVAIRVGDDVPAAFALSTTKAIREWSAADIELAKAVADQTGIAIRQAELYQKAETTSVREALVNRLTMAIRASLSLPEVLSTATRELGRALSASRVHLYLYDAEQTRLPLEHEYLAPNCDSVRHVEVTYEDPIGQRLLRSSQPLIIDDAVNYSGDTEEFNQYVRDHAEKFALCSQINYPLVVKGQFRGVLCIHQTDRIRRWTEDELALVEALAERLAIGIAQAELFEMVARGKTEWETTFDAMSDGLFIFDREGELKRVNRAGAAMEAVHPRLLLGRKCCEVLRTTEESGNCVVEQAIADCRSVTIEITPASLNRPLLVTIEPVLDEMNKAIAVVCTARDLSELRKVQAVAREHQSLLNNILESARESIYAVDHDGCFKWCNSATLKGLGYQRSDFIGRQLLEMVHEGDRELVHEKLSKALTGVPQTYEMRYFAYDGRLRHARVDNSPLVVEGRTTGVLGIARDITEQKEERERAARADKLRALGQLASGVAHDFNNSLAAILGRAQLLRRQLSDPALVRNLEIIQTAAEDAAATVRRIQTFARKSPVKEFELLDVRSLLNDAVEITRTRWENEARLRGLEYEVTLDAAAGKHTYGSASELREVFVNLIVNAVDAMPQGGKLEIGCRMHDQRLQLQFKDNGMGMPDDVRQKIFEPFFSTKGLHGTGLGLSVSYSIIERHGGSISVKSEAGNGTEFTIDLPAVHSEAAVVDVTPVADEMPSLKILVIDDEEAVRETLAEMLMASNHRVTLARSGQEALEKMVGGNFDFVFTDLAMPEMDGWETAREIRKYRPDIKVVLVTGYGSSTRPPEGEEDLVDGIIGKPFDFAQVGTTLNSLWARESELVNVR